MYFIIGIKEKIPAGFTYFSLDGMADIIHLIDKILVNKMLLKYQQKDKITFHGNHHYFKFDKDIKFSGIKIASNHKILKISHYLIYFNDKNFIHDLTLVSNEKFHYSNVKNLLSYKFEDIKNFISKLKEDAVEYSWNSNFIPK
jgi:hypothetical protein